MDPWPQPTPFLSSHLIPESPSSLAKGWFSHTFPGGRCLASLLYIQKQTVSGGGDPWGRNMPSLTLWPSLLRRRGGQWEESWSRRASRDLTVCTNRHQDSGEKRFSVLKRLHSKGNESEDDKIK